MLDINAIKKWNELRFGLVLSGGGAKGAYEAGVLRAMDELDFFDKVKVISGTSIGALNTIMLSRDDISVLTDLWNDVNFRQVMGTPEINGTDAVVDKLKYIAENRKSMNISDIKSSIKDELSDIEIKPVTQENVRTLLENNVNIEQLRASKRDYFVCAYNRNKQLPKFFNLKNLSDEMMIDAVLASSAIPHVYPPVMIRGEAFSDGGINDPELNAQNSINTPVEPMAYYDLDAVIVVYLSDTPKLVTPERYSGAMINIIPSESIEAVKFSGTVNFTRRAIETKMQLGYRDAMVVLAPILADFLKQKPNKLMS